MFAHSCSISARNGDDSIEARSGTAIPAWAHFFERLARTSATCVDVRSGCRSAIGDLAFGGGPLTPVLSSPVRSSLSFGRFRGIRGDEVVVSPAVERPIFHPYSDAP